ncbi:MAG: type I DNA topoisomerase [Candidatus Schekmanbacteria bacterium]|nr:type I DNA topoisomerase [Candidatus Schekmanbacteria bacterium]
MAKKLLIVESPAKAKTINKIVGKDFVVMATVGHIKDLPKSKLGINIEAGFEPDYVTIKSKSQVIKDLKKEAEKADEIYLAPDPDREGEIIAWHVASEIQSKSRKKPAKIYRVLFNEITKDAVKKAVSNPGEIDIQKVEAQQARRVLDRLVGYKISPLLWKKLMYGLSAGRVQSVALRLICEREESINKFVSEEYWSITAKLSASNPPEFNARLIEHMQQKIKISNESESSGILDYLNKQKYIVNRIEKKERKRNPSPPFITSTLQQEAYRHYGFSSKRTMAIAQQLYEGLEINGEGTIGLITYMRTDSVRIADEAKKAAREYIGEKYGLSYLPPSSPEYSVGKSAQDAHEAIRPTVITIEPDSISSFLSVDQLKIYKLIWQRFISSQMSPAVMDLTTIDVAAGDYTFRANGSILKFDGFRRVYLEGKDDEENGNGENGENVYLPEVAEGESVNLLELLPKQHFTEPPPRYTEATLVKELEKLGIGRPSTYANIMDKIEDRNYITKENKRFKPSELGQIVTTLLVKNFPDIFNVDFTASMETMLDEIEEGKAKRIDVLKSFYSPFEKDIEKASVEMEVKEEPTELNCEKCGSMMVKKWGRNGMFLACSKYPECKTTKDFKTDESGKTIPVEAEISSEVCEKCGKPMKVKAGRFGKFLACSGYPECKNTKKINGTSEPQNEENGKLLDEKCPKCEKQLTVRIGRFGRFEACSGYPKCRYIKPTSTGVKCQKENCTGVLIQKKSRKGIFYGCSNYPECDYAVWDKPIDRKCPNCGSQFMLEKRNGVKDSSKVACPNQECGYEEEQKSPQEG